MRYTCIGNALEMVFRKKVVSKIAKYIYIYIKNKPEFPSIMNLSGIVMLT